MIAITNANSDTLSILDPATETIRWTIPIGLTPVELEGPHHLAPSADGQFVYVPLSEAVPRSGSGPHGTHGAGDQPGYVVKLRTEDGSRVDQVQVEANPGDLVLSDDGKTGYTTHYDLLKYRDATRQGNIRLADTNLVVIDTESMSVRHRVPICPLTHAVRLTPDGQTAYASCSTDALAVVNLASDPPVAERKILPGGFEGSGCAYCPYALSLAPDGAVWLSGLGPNFGINGGGRIAVYDPASRSFDANRSLTFCGRVTFVNFSPDAAAPGAYFAYVPEQGPCGDKLWIYRVPAPGAAAVELASIVLPAEHCLNAHVMLTSPDERRGYLVCEGDHRSAGSVVLLDLENRRVDKSLPVGVFPDGLALIPERQ